MIFVKAKLSSTPSSLLKKILKSMNSSERGIFERMVTMSVNLTAKNNSNHAHQDLARYQVAELAKKHNVTIIWGK